MTWTQMDHANRGWAVFDRHEEPLYRYRLGRRWSDAGALDVWVMLNPSTADAFKLDPTVTRCAAFSRAWGASGIVVVNLFAVRSTDPAVLLRHPDPVGPENNGHIREVARVAGIDGGRIIAAWGAHPMGVERGRIVRSMILPEHFLCIGHTKDGSPRHPLYAPGTAEPIDWRPHW